jgi:predicted GNAT superfamily acetyltransferase
VLRLNAANRPALAALTDADLAELLACGGLHLVATDAAGDVLAYLLSFPSAGAYDDEEIRHFRRLVAEPFCYVCQIAVAAGHRGRRIGHALYEAVIDRARRGNVRTLCCDVNVDPPNVESQEFHRRLGFRRIDTRTMARGPTVAFLTRQL